MTTQREVCVVRWHDGSAKANWGGRATSLGLGRVARHHGAAITSIVNGTALVHGMEDDRRFERACRRAIAATARLTRRPTPRYNRGDFTTLTARAQRIVERPDPRDHRLQAVLDALEAAGEVWINGEGDLILLERPSLYRTLLIAHLAANLGKPVRMINTILSDPPGRAAVPEVERAVGEALERCDAVVYRDPVSLRISGERFPHLEATWAPDALFTWTGITPPHEPYGPGWEVLPPPLQDLLADGGRRYVALSGSSAIHRPGSAEIDDLRRFGRALAADGLEPVVVATDSGDDWMVTVAASEGWFTVPARVPLSSGYAVLAGASAFVSGRYHPSIMATVAGTPCVLTGSNSHKTESLAAVIGYELRSAPLGADDGARRAAVHGALDLDREVIAATAARRGIEALAHGALRAGADDGDDDADLTGRSGSRDLVR